MRVQGLGNGRERAVVGMAVLIVLFSLAGCQGSDDEGAATVAPSPPSSTTSSTEPVERSAPRWETVTTLSGRGATETKPFRIFPDAIQWRARWQCDGGHLRVTTVPPPRRKTPLVDAPCPGKGEGFSIVSGAVRLVVAAEGKWGLTVDQQVDFPLREPALEGMAPAAVVRQGDFFDVEMTGKGTARLYQLSDGATALRLEGFEVSNNTDLFLWLSEAVHPRTSAEAVAAPYIVLGNLKSTVGDQNYVLPAEIPPDKVRSIVIWCAPVAIAYIAAALGPPS